DPEEVNPGPQADLENTDIECIAVPDVRERVEREDGFGGTTERAGFGKQCIGERAEHDLRHEIRVSTENADIWHHSGGYADGGYIFTGRSGHSVDQPRRRRSMVSTMDIADIATTDHTAV